jgi:tetratricopeptide (TPR) repeat protein
MRKTGYLTLVLISLFLLSCFSAAKRANWLERRGETLLGKQKYKRAVKHLEKAEKAGVSDDKFLFMLGSNYLYLGRYKEAAVRFEKATKTDQKNPELWFRLGNAYFNLSDPAKAAEAYRKTIEIKPDFLEAIEALAMLYPDGGVSREEALAMWKKALETETREEWVTRAKYYIEQLEEKGNQ